ncbi:hypothetical protein BD560DRAFT_472752 [Blakeslea trispora]|nr:hypothetical protein BD560DRAFT_472752 [Blakeslea trispora]
MTISHGFVTPKSNQYKRFMLIEISFPKTRTLCTCLSGNAIRSLLFTALFVTTRRSFLEQQASFHQPYFLMSNKYHTTIEDCPDESELNQSQQFSGTTNINLSHLDGYSNSAQKQAWDEVDALEEQARSEKMQDQSMARENAIQAARIVKEAQQSSGI